MSRKFSDKEGGPPRKIGKRELLSNQRVEQKIQEWRQQLKEQAHTKQPYIKEKPMRKNKFTPEQLHEIITKGEPIVDVTCSVCDEHFDYIYDLLHHRELAHSHAIMLECTNCGEKFDKKAKLYNHLVVELSAYKCPRCESCFKTKALFDFHTSSAKCPISSTAKRMTMKCSQCDDEFTTVAELLTHRLAEHGESVMLTCGLCGQIFTKRGGIHRHLNLEYKCYQCNVCGRSLRDKYRLTQHESKCCSSTSSTSPVAMILKCYTCNSTDFSNIPQLLSHILSQHGKAAMLKCGICGKAFNSRTGILRHLNIEYELYNCEVCGKHVGEKYLLIKHQQSSHCQSYKESLKVDVDQNLIQCSECGETPASVDSLLAHRKEEHGDMTMLTCGICGERFAKRADVRQHLMEEYGINDDLSKEEEEEEDFIVEEVEDESIRNTSTMQALIEKLISGEQTSEQCEKCSTQFESAADLFVHKVNCEGVEEEKTDVIIECVQCQFQSVDQEEIDEHRWETHQKTKFQCGLCDLEFLNHRQLNDHHNKESRKFVCQTCNESFRSQIILEKHRKSHPTCRQFFGILKK